MYFIGPLFHFTCRVFLIMLIENLPKKITLVHIKHSNRTFLKIGNHFQINKMYTPSMVNTRE